MEGGQRGIREKERENGKEHEEKEEIEDEEGEMIEIA